MSNDKARLKPFVNELEWVARILGVAEQNLVYRASFLMNDVAPAHTWTERAESRWRWILESAGMKLAYRRPRAQVARHAMYRAVSELLDAGLARPSMAKFLWESLRPFDFDMILRHPAQRPRECQPMVGLDDYSDPPPDWSNAAVCRSALKNRRMISFGSQRVLAERTRPKAA